VGEPESAHAAYVLDQVVGAVAVGGQQGEQAEEEGRPKGNGRQYDM